jgi:hypothetical protein
VAHIAKLPKLEELGLNATDFGDDAILELAKMGGLKLLMVRDTKISPAGLARLRAALPNCTVVGGDAQQSDSGSHKKGK